MIDGTPPSNIFGKHPNIPYIESLGNPEILSRNAAGAAIILAVLYGWKSRKGRKPAVWKTHGSDTRLYLAGANGRERFGAGGT